MRKLTTEEKLTIAIDFIKKIQDYVPKSNIIVDDYGNDRYVIESSEITNIKDLAWHTLADLTE